MSRLTQTDKIWLDTLAPRVLGVINEYESELARLREAIDTVKAKCAEDWEDPTVEAFQAEILATLGQLEGE